MLLNRVNRFVRKWKNRRLREDDDLEGMQRPEFRELSNAISCLQYVPLLPLLLCESAMSGNADEERMSFPPHMRNPCRTGPNGKREIELIVSLPPSLN